MKTGELKAIQVDLKSNYGYVYFKETGAVAGHFLLWIMIIVIMIVVGENVIL